MSLPDGEVVKEFATLHPDLDIWVQKREDKLTTLPTFQIIRYIVACYDKESPLVDAYKKRWIIKKRESAIVADFPKNSDGHFSKEADEVIFCRNKVINKVVLRYLYLQHNRLFQTYVIYNEMYLHQSEELIRYDFANPTHAKAAKENLDTLDKDIQELELKIFSGDETNKMKELLYEESTGTFNDLRPESIVSRLEKGLTAVDYNPYGKNYKPEEMVFMGDE